MPDPLPPACKTVHRIQKNILAGPERRLLNWLCGIMPRWVTPDLLTMAGIVGALMTFAGYALSGFALGWLWLAIAGYVVQWFGDSLDGSLARWRHIERPSYGYFIDHSCDGIVTLLILAGMGFSPFVRVDVAMFTVTGYLLLSIHAYLAARVMGEFKLSYGIAGPTELRFLLIGLTVAMMVRGANPHPLPAISGFDIFVGTIGAIFVVLFIMQTLTTGRQLARTDSGQSG